MKLKEYSSTTIKEIIWCTGPSAKNLFTCLNIDEFGLNLAEEDTAIFTINSKIRENGWKKTVVIDAEDTSIYVLGAYVSQKVSGKLLIKNFVYHCNGYYYTVTCYDCLWSQQWSMDVVKNSYKKSQEKLWSKSFVTWMWWRAFNSSSCIEQSQKHLWTNMFMGKKEMGCAETWATQWEKIKKKSTRRLMPDEDKSNHICLRANYLACCQNNFQLSRHPSPIWNS